MDTPLGERLRTLRLLGQVKSQRELDRLAGIKRGRTRQIEIGVSVNPTRLSALGYKRALGCSLDWLLAGDGAPPPADLVQSAVARARELLAHTPTLAQSPASVESAP